MKKLIFGILIIFLFSCNKNDRIVGNWVRIGDPFRGMTIEVTKHDNKYVGKLIKVTDTAIIRGYEVHDVKWKDIIEINDSIYEFQDLRKGKYFGTTSFEYQDAFITLKISDTIQIRQAVKGNEKWGTQQKWYKIKE